MSISWEREVSVVLRKMCKSKIHRATVTEANLNYVGSITVDQKLLAAADILEYELVQVLNINNGERFETYAIAGEPDSGVICLNGAAARLVAPGDLVIIIAYGLVTDAEARDWRPRIVYVNAANQIVQP
jgi:aspartate 1-decarboxylase